MYHLIGPKPSESFSYKIICGISSFGRAEPCQGSGSRFEPDIPLQLTHSPSLVIDSSNRGVFYFQLVHSVMVALQILILSVGVRNPVGLPILKEKYHETSNI